MLSFKKQVLEIFFTNRLIKKKENRYKVDFNNLSLIKEKKIISVFKVDRYKTSYKQISTLFAFLYSQKITFSLILSKNSIYILFYLKEHEDTSKLLETINSFNFISPSDINNCLTFSQSKLKRKNEQILVKEKDHEYYNILYLLKKVKSENVYKTKLATNLLLNLTKTEFTTIVVSQIFSTKKTNGQGNWSLMLSLKNTSPIHLEENHNDFLSIVQDNPSKVDWVLKRLNLNEVINNQTNISLKLPWIRNEGLIQDIIDLKSLFELYSKEEQSDNINVPKNNLNLNESNYTKKMSSHKVLPSVKTLFPQMFPGNSMDKPINIKSELTILNSDIENFVPVESQTIKAELEKIPAVMNKESIIARLIETFEKLGFRKTMLFEHKFELILRKESFYILVKIQLEYLKSGHVYEILDELELFSDLKKQHSCVIVTENVDKNALKLLKQYDLILLKLSDFEKNILDEVLLGQMDRIYHSPNQYTM